MSWLKIELKGTNKLKRNLENLRREAKLDVKRSLVEASLRTESDAKVRAPVDTGRLRSSIQSRVTADNEAVVQANTNYAPFVEFGTGQEFDVSHIRDTDLRGEAVDAASTFRGNNQRQVNKQPQPFLYPAFESQRKFWIKALKKIFK